MKAKLGKVGDGGRSGVSDLAAPLLTPSMDDLRDPIAVCRGFECHADEGLNARSQGAKPCFADALWLGLHRRPEVLASGRC